MTSARGWIAAGLFCLLAGSPGAVLAQGRGYPWMQVLDGREIQADYLDDGAGFEPRLRAGRLAPLGLTAADVDGDGLADLIAAYAGPDGGFLAVHRANLDLRDPNGPRARRHRAEGTFVDRPFLPGVRVVAVPQVPRFVAAGDLDDDGRSDVVLAGDGPDGLWWLPATEAGGLDMARHVPLAGTVTALAAGNVDRRHDGDEIVAAVRSRERTELLLLRHRDGTLRAGPPILATADPITALALGRLDGNATLDLAVAAGRELMLFPGRSSGTLAVSPAWSQTFPAVIRAVTLGRLAVGERRGEGLAVLLEDDTLRLLLPERNGTGGLSFASIEETLPPESAARGLVLSNLSNRPGHDLLVQEAEGMRLPVRIGGLKDPTWTAFETAAPVAAVLPMFLNDDPFADLVLQLEGSAAPTVLISMAASIFTVDSTADDPDADTSDELCATAGGLCTLRAALEQANASGGTDAIGFDIPGVGPHTIQPASPLPAILDPLILDATTEPDYAGTPVVELDGSVAGLTDGLFLATGSTTIEGLAINRFGSAGIRLLGAEVTENRIQSCYIGTDLAGNAAAANLGGGVQVAGGAYLNVIGTDGDGVADDREGNLISGNEGDGIFLGDEGTDQNVVAGNLVGTDASGSSANGNTGSGVLMVAGPASNVIGTDGDGVSDDLERNVVSGNGGVGVLIAWDSTDNVVAGNRIGTDEAGVLAVPNGGFGVELSNGALRNRIGTNDDGTSDVLERNVISGNLSYGISVFGSPSSDSNVIAGNRIGTQADGVTPLGNQSHGIVLNTDASYNIIGGLGTTPGSCDGPCNVIAYNGVGASQDGVRIVAGVHNAVVGNVIHDNYAGSGIDIAVAAATPNDPGDTDGGANNGQNFPVLDDATTSSGTTTVDGVLDSVPSTEFRLEFFSSAACDPSGYGEGESLVAVHTVITDGAGQASFSLPITPEVPAGHWISATATRMEPGNTPTDTSEFSPCLGVGAPVAAGTVPDGNVVPGIQLTASRGAVTNEVVLDWDDSCVAADTDYAVYIGTLGDFTSHWARRCSTGGATTTTFRNNDPAIYLLVVPLSLNREGSYGVDGDGIDRPPGYSVCHPQEVQECD